MIPSVKKIQERRTQGRIQCAQILSTCPVIKAAIAKENKLKNQHSLNKEEVDELLGIYPVKED